MPEEVLSSACQGQQGLFHPGCAQHTLPTELQRFVQESEEYLVCFWGVCQ